MRRARKLGWIAVAGQLGTMVFTRLRKLFLSGRDQRGSLATAWRCSHAPTSGSSTSHPPIRRNLPKRSGQMQAEVVLLAGCRLLSKATLAAIPCPVLNYHAGITPKYRGMNGGYWALATGDAGNFGATVHLVDAGVDTGDVLHQVRGKPQPGDNLTNYALRLAALSRDICIRGVEDALEGRLAPIKPDMPSKQWYHPTIWFYLWTGLTKGVW